MYLVMSMMLFNDIIIIVATNRSVPSGFMKKKKGRGDASVWN
jgi:uncharacterized membrane protein